MKISIRWIMYEVEANKEKNKMYVNKWASVTINKFQCTLEDVQIAFSRAEHSDGTTV